MAGPLIAPSILAADFAELADEAAAVTGADWLHVDVMDNHFVPNLTIGLPVVEALLKRTNIPMDCHLMIDNPDKWAPPYAEAGAYNVTFHAEATDNPVGVARDIRAAGAKAGLSVKPGTPIDPYLEILPEFDRGDSADSGGGCATARGAGPGPQPGAFGRRPSLGLDRSSAPTRLGAEHAAVGRAGVVRKALAGRENREGGRRQAAAASKHLRI